MCIVFSRDLEQQLGSWSTSPGLARIEAELSSLRASRTNVIRYCDLSQAHETRRAEASALRSQALAISDKLRHANITYEKLATEVGSSIDQ